jgi:hypothetical protein
MAGRVRRRMGTAGWAIAVSNGAGSFGRVPHSASHAGGSPTAGRQDPASQTSKRHWSFGTISADRIDEKT